MRRDLTSHSGVAVLRPRSALFLRSAFSFRQVTKPRNSSHDIVISLHENGGLSSDMQQVLTAKVGLGASYHI
jgi:hypothetical protein